MSVPKAFAKRGLLSTADVAEQLGVHRSTVWWWIDTKVLVAEREGVFHGVSPDVLQTFIKTWPGLIEKAREQNRKKKKGARK